MGVLRAQDLMGLDCPKGGLNSQNWDVMTPNKDRFRVLSGEVLEPQGRHSSFQAKVKRLDGEG